MKEVEAELIELFDTRVVTSVISYVLLIILALAALRLAIPALRLLMRIAFWPVYLILYPVRALLFFTKLTLKLIFLIAIASFLYSLFGELVNPEMIKAALLQVLHQLEHLIHNLQS